MRADAARRRASIVREARHLFAARGSDVALEAVAEAAGVGIATLYRNFESRAALAEAVALAILDDIAEAGVQALGEMAQGEMDQGADEAWSAYVRRLVDLDLGALAAALAEHAGRDLAPAVREAQDRTLAGVGEVLAAARAAGAVRADLTALELVLAIGTITRPQPAALRGAAPDLVPHLVSILVAGMRAGERG